VTTITTIPLDLFTHITAKAPPVARHRRTEAKYKYVPPAPPSAPHTLMFGDSIDRNIVNALCLKYGMNYTDVPHIQHAKHGIPTVGKFPLLRFPAADSVHYGDEQKHPACYCHLNNTKPIGGVIAYVHLLGSDNGPYFGLNNHDAYAPTKARIRHVLEFWKERMPIGVPAGKFPEKIFFNTVNWDLRKNYEYGGIRKENVKAMADATERFRVNVNEDLMLIRKIAGPAADISLRTSPHSDSKREGAPDAQVTTGDLTQSYNAALRLLARQDDLSFFDFENLIWELGAHNYTKVKEELYFDKGSHPHGWISAMAGDIIAETAKSAYYTKRLQIPENSTAADPLFIPAFADGLPIRFGAGQRQIYIYSNGTGGGILRPVNDWGAFVSHGYDTDDVVDVDLLWLSLIPLGPPFQ